MSSADVVHMGVELVVEFDYTPAQGDGRNEEYCEADVAVSKVYVGGVNIIEMLTGDQIESIEMNLLESRKEAA